jgi:hypothetical protein
MDSSANTAPKVFLWRVEMKSWNIGEHLETLMGILKSVCSSA